MEHEIMAEHMPYTHYHHPYGHYGHGHEGLEELILSNAMHSGHSQIQSDIHEASVNNLKETADASRDNIAATNNIGNLNLGATERNGGETRMSVERASGVIRDQVANFANQAARDHGRIIEEMCDVRKELSDGFGETKLEVVKGHGDIKLEMCKQHADLARQADTLAAETRRQLAECCCEMKELVRAENTATRQLMQSNALDDANRRADQAQRENDLLRIQANVGVLGGRAA